MPRQIEMEPTVPKPMALPGTEVWDPEYQAATWRQYPATLSQSINRVRHVFQGMPKQDQIEVGLIEPDRGEGLAVEDDSLWCSFGWEFTPLNSVTFAALPGQDSSDRASSATNVENPGGRTGALLG